MAKQTVPPLPLPRNWPQKVRSAAVHAIALARLALTTARGQANSAARAALRTKTTMAKRSALRWLARCCTRTTRPAPRLERQLPGRAQASSHRRTDQSGVAELRLRWVTTVGGEVRLDRAGIFITARSSVV